MKMMTLPLLLCAMIALSRVADAACPDNWTQINSRCFTYILTPMSWSDAHKNCDCMGGHLASVHSANEYQDIQSLIWSITRDYKSAWIGGSDDLKEGTWTWTDGTALDYKGWCSQEPNNFGGGQQCMDMNFSEKRCWDDENCSLKLPSVCAKNV